MNKIIEIIEPSEDLFILFEQIKKNLNEIIPSAEISLIGALAVPMKGKKEMDILIVTDSVAEAQNKLSDMGYSRGPIVDGEGFCKNDNYKVEISLHIVPPKHKRIQVYFKTIEKLQKDDILRKKYEEFKMDFNGSSINEYKRAKNKFLIDNNLI